MVANPGAVSAATFSYSDPTCSSFISTSTQNGDLGVTCNRPPVATVPQCSLVAAPATISAGAQSLLTATCSPAATSYTWTGTAATGATASIAPTATSTYTVRGSNAAGAGNVASATVTVSASLAPPQCTLTANPSTLSAPGWVTLTASCSPAATSYSWSNITGNTSSVYVTATSTQSVRGSNAAGAGNLATTIVTLASTPTPPPPVPPGPPSSCNGLSVHSVIRDWDADNAKTYYDRTMTRGQVFVFSFTTGAASATPGRFSFAEWAGSTPVRTLVLSESACDFTLGTQPAAIGKNGTGYFTVGVVVRGYPTLKANTKYFANFKNESPTTAPGVDTCLAGENCGFLFELAHF